MKFDTFNYSTFSIDPATIFARLIEEEVAIETLGCDSDFATNPFRFQLNIL